MATIRHPTPLALGQFHTVTLLRSLTQGSLIVGSLAPVNGTSQVSPPDPHFRPPPTSAQPLSTIPDFSTAQGKFQGLDLNEELYLGGYPDYDAIPKAGLSSGFIGEPPPCLPARASLRRPGESTAGYGLGPPRPSSTAALLTMPACCPGCVRELRIQGEEIIFHDLNLTAHGISHCPTCRDRPCQVTPHCTRHSAAPGPCPQPGQTPVGSGGEAGCSGPDFWGRLRRMGANVRTQRAAATCASARLASPGAAVSTLRPCTATQVCDPPFWSLPPLGAGLCPLLPLQIHPPHC